MLLRLPIWQHLAYVFMAEAGWHRLEDALLGEHPRNLRGEAINGSTHPRRVDACIWQTDADLARDSERNRREPEAQK